MLFQVVEVLLAIPIVAIAVLSIAGILLALSVPFLWLIVLAGRGAEWCLGRVNRVIEVIDP